MVQLVSLILIHCKCVFEEICGVFIAYGYMCMGINVFLCKLDTRPPTLAHVGLCVAMAVF